MSAWALLVLLGLGGVTLMIQQNLRRFRPAPGPAGPVPPVSVLIPVRDEEAAVEGAVRAACAQTADVEVVVLDDESTDGTPTILARLEAELPRLRVVSGRPLPAGWAGKAWACWQLATGHARHPWVLFVDCDVRLEPDAVARAVAAARAQGADFVSAFPRQLTPSAGEALIVPLIYLVLLAYLPMGLVRRLSLPALAAGCGQFMLVRRAAYLAADGHRAIRRTLHDGLQLARRMKAAGAPIGLIDGLDLASCRMYAGFGATWRGFTRNAYEGLGSPGALAAMVVLNGALFVLPFVAGPWLYLSAGPAAAAPWGAAALTAVALRVGLARRFRSPLWTAAATPLAVTLMIGIQLHSFVNATLGRRITWRARSYRAG